VTTATAEAEFGAEPSEELAARRRARYLAQARARGQRLQTATGRSLAISVITLGEASYGALLRKWSAWRTAEMLEFSTGHFAVVELGREAAVEYGLPLVTLNRRHFEPLTLHGLALL
jgi:predicted nucleic acid-binding protein